MKLTLTGLGEVDSDTLLLDRHLLDKAVSTPGAMRELESLLNQHNLLVPFDVESISEVVKSKIHLIESLKTDIETLRGILKRRSIEPT